MGNLLRPARRRMCVEHTVPKLGASERLACPVPGQPRSTQRKTDLAYPQPSPASPAGPTARFRFVGHYAACLFPPAPRGSRKMSTRCHTRR